MVGPQGSGKGTQADLLARRLGIPHVGMGTLFRTEIASGSELGARINAIVSKGDLVPAEVADEVLAARLASPDARTGVIFDGFPRNREQAASLDAILGKLGVRLDHVVYLNISDDEAVKRLAGRWVCTDAACERNYHDEYLPPRSAGKCDACGSALRHRPDDIPEVIRHRLEVYHRDTAPLVDLYRERGLVREVDGERPIEVVAEDVYRAVAP